MFDQEWISHSNWSKDSNQSDEKFGYRSNSNNSQLTNDNQEQTKNCIPKWPTKRDRNLDFDEKKDSIEMESTRSEEENNLSEE